MDGGFIMSMAFADLTYTPFAEQWFHDGNGRLRLIRPLRPQDGNVFGHFLEALSPQTRQWFAPHPLDTATAMQLAANPQPDQVLRLVILDRSGGEQEGAILGYLILQMGLAPHEVARFEPYAIDYQPALCVSLAPVVAEGWQAQGLGAPLMRHGLHLCRELGRQAVILMGGVQEGNSRAVHFYLRHGFHRLDSFEWPTGVMNDDMIRWL